MRKPIPEVAHLVWPYSLAAIGVVVCFEVALVATWRLLTMIGFREIFSTHALRWVDVIVGCAVAATGLTAIVTVHLLVLGRVGGPLVIYLAAGVVAGLALVLLLLVMRHLLAAATAEHRELARVI